MGKKCLKLHHRKFDKVGFFLRERYTWLYDSDMLAVLCPFGAIATIQSKKSDQSFC